MSVDTLTYMVLLADLGVVNAIARTCRAAARFVETHKLNIAGRLTASEMVDDGTVERLPNGVLHGVLDTPVACSTWSGMPMSIRMRWELGVAKGWEITHFDFSRTLGHSGTHHVLRGLCNSISVSDRVGSLGRSLFTLEICAETGKLLSSVTQNGEVARPLRDHLKDGELVPEVINAWVDDMLAGCETLKSAGTPWTLRADVGDEMACLINRSGTLKLREVRRDR